MVVSTLYLSEFYTFKGYVAGDDRVVLDPDTPLELQIFFHVRVGNQNFFAGKYAAALNAYLAAWGKIPRLLNPRIPDYAVLVDDSLLLRANLVDSLIDSSVEIHRLRDLAGPNVVLGAPANPPPAIQEMAKQFGVTTATPAQSHFDRGVSFVQMGQTNLAQQELEQALRLNRSDPAFEAEIKVALAAIDVSNSQFGEAKGKLESALSHFKSARQLDKTAAVSHNLKIVNRLVGDGAGAVGDTPQLTSFAINPSITLRSQISASTASFERAVGTQSLLLQSRDGFWLDVPTVRAQAAKTSVGVLREGRSVNVDLAANPAVVIRQQLLQPRVNASSLSALDTYLWLPPQFVSYLSHVTGFILPMALGDTYAQLGDYERAATYYTNVRDYQFLNLPIERPMVWSRLARTFVRLGNRLYRDRDMAGARAQYEKVLRIVDGGFDLAGPLYTGGFAALRQQTLDFLNAPDKIAFTAVDYSRRLILLEAQANLRQILNGINYLGFPEEIIPIHSWRYLQNVARYFANQAIQMERSYVNFKDAAERDEATRLVLEQSVDAAAAARRVEQLRVTAAAQQARVADLSAEAAQTRLDNSIDRRSDYDVTSKELATLDAINAWATGPMDRAVVSASWAGTLGIPPGEYDTYQVTKFASRQRSKISRRYELNNMNRQIAEMEDAKAIADAQVRVAESMVEVAFAQQELAELREEQAQAQLDNFNSEEFTPELWNNLADAQREISQRYLDWAIGAAFLMERAFEFEFDLDVNRVRFDYARSELNGLLAADYLLADIDQFSFDRLLDTEKQLPAKVVISLADRYPFQFFQEFQRTGRLEFDTQLEDFDRMHPGAHLRKLRRVEVVVEGLIGREGAQGILKNSGFSLFRDRDGLRKVRVQKPETMMLSLYDLRRDGFVFTTEEGVLEVFENSGVASGWTIEFPPESNDLDYRAVSNIHVVFYFDAYYSDRVADVARAELEAGAVHEHNLGLALRFQYPDEFFSLQDTGEVVFKMDNSYLPFNHEGPEILEAQVVIETEAGVSNVGLVVNVQSAAGGAAVTQATDASGMIATSAGASDLNALRDLPLLDTWTVRLDQAANAAAFAAGFSWEKVTNVFLFFEYRYTPRGRRSFGDDFGADTLAEFDVIDDAAATTDAPSAWAHDAAFDGSIRQTSNIFGSAGDINTTPDKPGTYLVRRTSPQWPALRDLTLRGRLRAGDEDGIGYVFRFQDADNFYFFLMDRARKYQRLGKKVGGVFRELDTPAVEGLAQGHELDRTYDISIAAAGDAFSVFIDGARALTGRDGSLRQPGRVGLYSWNNSDARFLDLAVTAI